MRVSHPSTCSRKKHGQMHDGASCPWEQGRTVIPAYCGQADTDAPRQDRDTLACMHPPGYPPPCTLTDLGRGTNHRLSFPEGAWHGV